MTTRAVDFPVMLPMVRMAAAFGVLAVTSCGDGAGGKRSGLVPGYTRPDEPPALVNDDELPFRYPPALYARKVQANVTLRLFIDRDGRTRADSTRVEESSGFESLDSAAVRGSQELRFVPAKLHGEPMPVSVLFPVYFRHPEATPLPGDTILGRRKEEGGRRAVTRPAAKAPTTKNP
jgi:TonB family protein